MSATDIKKRFNINSNSELTEKKFFSLQFYTLMIFQRILKEFQKNMILN